MDHLDCPEHSTWLRRQTWFEKQIEDAMHPAAGYIIGEHANGWLVDLQCVFCAGAWSSALVVAFTIIDAHLREAEMVDIEHLGAKQVLAVAGLDGEYEWLRKKRNRLLHFRGRPELTVEKQWDSRARHEREARRAVKLAVQVLFQSPFV
jgi:hypothetical protein